MGHGESRPEARSEKREVEVEVEAEVEEETKNNSIYLSEKERKDKERKFAEYYQDVPEDEIGSVALKYAKMALSFHNLGEDDTANRFADIAEEGGLVISRTTFMFEG